MNKNKILYIGMDISAGVKTGGDYCVMMNQAMLKHLYGDNVRVISVPKIPLWKHLFNLLTLRTYGQTRKLTREINQVLSEGVDFLCVDGAYYGGYVENCAKMGLRYIVFCHNVENVFYKSRYESEKSIFSWLLWKYMHFNESKTFKYCTKIIALNERDSAGIHELYGRKADMVLPTFYHAIPKEKLLKSQNRNPYLLFVGSNFYANNNGIMWFIKNVSSHIHYPLVVAGSCCDIIRKEINISDYPNVTLRGFVDDLDDLYINAYGVVCPIFAGSGMKTKTIEAMRYGKNIFGTTEAFEGIDVDYSEVGDLCNTESEFIDKIESRSIEQFNEYTYSAFLKSFSTENAFKRFSLFVDEFIDSDN